MEYIILDLEWNNGYCKQVGKAINEIIEIGALRVDEQLHILDSFTQLVRPTLTRKLSSLVKRLTHITDDLLLQNGIDFVDAINQFKDWLGTEEKVLMTWSNTDIYILTETYQYYYDSDQIDFIANYADAQKYCQSFIPDLENSNNQISLINAAEKLGINSDDETLHRALGDCVLTAKCFIHCFDETKFKKYVHTCDHDFFAKLLFKPYFIEDPSTVGVSLAALHFDCPFCKIGVSRMTAYSPANNGFRAAFHCKKCKRKFYGTCRIKQQYKRVDVKKRIAVIEKPVPTVVRKTSE